MFCTGSQCMWCLPCCCLQTVTHSNAAYLPTMICSLRCIVCKIGILPAAVAITLFFFFPRLFTSLVNTVHASRIGLALFIRGHDQVVWHKSNCRTHHNDCTESMSQAASRKPHISSGVIVSRTHNVSLVLLGKVATKPEERLKHLNNQFTNTIRASSLLHDVNQKLFHSRELVIWSSDHHPAPAYDARYLLQPLGVTFLQHDLSPYCGFFDLCAQRDSLKVSKCFTVTVCNCSNTK